MKNYLVNVDMIWSRNFTLKAKNKPEAKRKAFERFLKYAKSKDFNISVDDI